VISKEELPPTLQEYIWVFRPNLPPPRQIHPPPPRQTASISSTDKTSTIRNQSHFVFLLKVIE